MPSLRLVLLVRGLVGLPYFRGQNSLHVVEPWKRTPDHSLSKHVGPGEAEDGSSDV